MTAKLFRRILIADDDANTRFLCTEILQAAGFAAHTAPDGASALQMLSAHEYDLVITDVNMPLLDGIGLYAGAAAMEPRLKDRFIFMTAGLGSDTWPKLKGLEAKCIMKPFKISEFLGFVDTVILGAAGQGHRGAYDSQRADRRFELSERCEVYEKSSTHKRVFSAIVSDVSRGGIKVIYPGAALKAQAQVSVYTRINGLDFLRNATVVWSHEISGCGVASGLSLTNPIPVTSVLVRSAHAEERLAAV